MTTAVFDNPSTCCREWWCDGKLNSFVSWALIASKTMPSWMPSSVREPWQPGRIVGAVEAIAIDAAKGRSGT